MKLRITILTLILGLLLAAGCTPTGVESGPAAETVAPETTAEPTTEPAPEPEEGELESMNPPLSSGEVPQELFDSVLADLLALTGKESSAVTVVSSEAITWNDGALGCPQPGVMYTMAIIDGYQVIFDVDGETFDYHLSDRGQFVLCEDARPGQN